ncbi:MAG: cation:proton antiporter [Planctomycetes bacterium]|nr:cation:proton antiporter [Planctomycetota bacterium]
MYLDPAMPALATAILVVLIVGMFVRRMGQPLILAYLVTGALIGPSALNLVPAELGIDRLGALGVLLLLFFLGVEVDPAHLARRWRVAAFGTTLQILLSVAVVALLMPLADWPLARVVLIGFAISLSSTAVIQRLQRPEERGSELSGDVTAISLTQDLALAPMLIVLGLFMGDGFDWGVAGLQIVGGAALLGLAAYVVFRRNQIHLPFAKLIAGDAELEVFLALALCFGLSVLSGLTHLSAALGAFVAGLVVGSAHETRRFHHHLKPFEVVFLAAFFVSVGMLIDLQFLVDNIGTVAGLVALVLALNTVVNFLMLRAFGRSWRRSLIGGSMLAQVGEFAFVLALVGHSSGILSDFGYQMTLAMVAISLAVSPAWIALARRVARDAGAAGIPAG